MPHLNFASRSANTTRSADGRQVAHRAGYARSTQAQCRRLVKDCSRAINDSQYDQCSCACTQQSELLIIAGKLAVTAACFWYLSWQIDVSAVSSSIRLFDVRWAALAILLAMLQIPLVGMRWRAILDALEAVNRRMTSASIVAITAIGLFFAQVLPSMMGEGIRAWLLVRLGCDWRRALTSVVIDRAVGVGLLVAFGFIILLLPSGLSALGGYRDLVLMIYGMLLLAGAVGLLLLPPLIAFLNRMPYLRWVAGLAADVRCVVLSRQRLAIVLSAAAVFHSFSILIIWSLARAQGW